MGLTDVVKKVADVFVGSSAPGIITNAAQQGANYIAGSLPDLPSTNLIGGTMRGIGDTAQQFGGTMRGAGQDLFGGAMQGIGQAGGAFGSSMPGIGRNDPFGRSMSFGGSGNIFGDAFGTSGNPWAMEDRRFSGKMEADRQKAWEDSFRDVGGKSFTSETSGVTGNAAKANTNRIAGTDKWDPMILKAAAASNVPASVLKAMMAIESGGVQPDGANYAGAVGLMQILPKYWQHVADKYGGDLSDPETNIMTAADIMSQLYKQHGSWERAATAYFTGSPDLTGASDAYSTDYQYIDMFKNNIAWIESNAKATGGSVPVPQGGGAFPVKGYSGGLELHWGSHPGAIDIFADYGTPVLAIKGGTATSGYSDIGGYWTMITGDDGLQYYYAHMDKMGPNGRVDAGQYIAGVSDTGNAKGTGPHLHLGIGTQIYSGTGPQGGAGDINVIEYLKTLQRY